MGDKTDEPGPVTAQEAEELEKELQALQQRLNDADALRPFAVYIKQVKTMADLKKPWTRLCAVNYRSNAEVIAQKWVERCRGFWAFAGINDGLDVPSFSHASLKAGTTHGRVPATSLPEGKEETR
jgi:hypothetical protein